jgi:hypothetical protein
MIVLAATVSSLIACTACYMRITVAPPAVGYDAPIANYLVDSF